jgi:hypothetical protein
MEESLLALHHQRQEEELSLDTSTTVPWHPFTLEEASMMMMMMMMRIMMLLTVLFVSTTTDAAFKDVLQ